MVALWMVLAIWVNYPPTEFQLGKYLNGWGLRILTLGLIIGGLWLGRIKNDWLTLTLVFTSFGLWGVWLGYPRESLLLAMFLASLGIKNTKIMYLGWLVLLTVVGIVNFKSAAIWQVAKINDVESEVVRRFTSEDSLTQKIELPFKIRRLATNKLTVGGGKVWKELVAVADLESIFFGEIHPLFRKTLTMFVWPAVWLFLLGLAVTKNRSRWISLVPGVIHFWISGGPYYIRFVWLVPGMALIIGDGLRALWDYKKWLGWSGAIILVYGIMAMGRDLIVRPDYWLDNRPLLYKEIYGRLGETEGSKVYVTDVLGNSQKYCQYYIKNRCNNLDFGIPKTKQKDEIYVGFIGEFLGSSFKNTFTDDWIKVMEDNGYEVLDFFDIRDSIAYGLGERVIVVKKL
jgi:hypothetical protein